MRLARMNIGGSPEAVLIKDGKQVRVKTFLPDAPEDWNALVGWMHENTSTASGKFEDAEGENINGKLAIPAANDTRILCTGLNYVDHAKEGNLPIPEFPVFFIRFPQSFVAQGENLIAPKVSRYFDYESELVIVIGRRAKHVSKEEALAYVYGYTVAMDGSLRDLQKRSVQWTLGKNVDDSGALGPDLLHASQLPEGAKDLAVTAKVNGEMLQNGNTGDMIFDVATLVATLSDCMTLLPGDLILTGTPAGVGFARKPPIYLKEGDTVEVTVEKIGTLTNKVVAEK